MEGENPGGGAGSEESATKDYQSLHVARKWTDEKHNLFLNSIEASFIRQLHCGEHGPSNLLGWLPIAVEKYTKPSRSNSNRISCSQFKVLRRGCWEIINFERTRFRGGIENETQLLFENPWIQHFTSHIIGKKVHRGPLNQVENNELSPQKMQLENPSTKQDQPSCSRMYLWHSFQRNTEASDQNFADMVSQGGRLNRKIRTKRVKTEITNTKDEPFYLEIQP